MEGLQQATGLSREQILRVIVRNNKSIEARSSQVHGMVFRLRARINKQQEEPLLERALDYLTLGKRNKVA
jgi:hypothetical protein